MTSVLDFPQLWQKPSFESLVACLDALEIKPPIWNNARTQDNSAAEQETHFSHRREVAIYLSAMVKSSLAWLSSDEEREAIWDLASKRISERSGRQGAFRFPPFPAARASLSLTSHCNSHGRNHPPVAFHHEHEAFV